MTHPTQIFYQLQKYLYLGDIAADACTESTLCIHKFSTGPLRGTQVLIGILVMVFTDQQLLIANA